MSSELSVIVPTIGRQDLLNATLDSLIAAGAATADVEVVVVDNSRDGDLVNRAVFEDMFRVLPRLRVMHEPKPGPASARNAGAAATTGEWIAFIDDDLAVAPGWLNGLRSVFRVGKTDALVGRILPRFQEDPPAWLDRGEWGALGLLDAGETPLAIDAASPMCMMAGNFVVRRSLFVSQGGYDTELQRSEDHELTLRLIAAGARCEYRPEATVFSVIVPERMTARYHKRWHLLHGYYSQILHRRHPLPVKHVGVVPRFMLREAARLWAPTRGRYELRRQFERAYYRGYARAVLGLDPPNPRLL